MVDLQDGDQWIELEKAEPGIGSMLQWLPQSKTDVIWNDRQGDQFISHILDVKTGKKRTLPRRIYPVSPDAGKHPLVLIAERHGRKAQKDDPLFAIGAFCEAHVDEVGCLSMSR